MKRRVITITEYEVNQMSWQDIIKVSRYEKNLADEFAPEEMEEFNQSEFARKVFEDFRPQLEERGEKKLTDAKAKKIMQSYEELLNMTDDKRKLFAIIDALGYPNPRYGE